MTVLIVAQELDRTVDGVVAALADRAVPVFRMDCSWFPQRLELNAELVGGQWRGYLAASDRRVDLEDVRAVWYRSPSQFSFPAGMSEPERMHAEREARIGLGGVLMSLPGQVNHPHRVAAATKPWQLAVAGKCGLPVPRTRIVNRAEAVQDFVAAAPGDVICKLFVNGLTEQGRSMVGHTHMVSQSDVADLRGISTTAHQLQHFVHKTSDLRVVVIGKDAFGVAIHPLSEAARVDFRSDYRALRHERVEISAALESDIHALMERLGLVFGCIDFSVDFTGSAHFLEVNPTGQFGWLEGTTGVPITDTLADFLARSPTQHLPLQGPA